MTAKPANTDEYISTFPAETQKQLEEIRAAIRKAAPEAEELISYMMPSYKFHGMLVHFAGYKNHIGFYPGPDGLNAFREEVDAWKNAKGSVQFPLGKPLPLGLVTKIVEFRVKQNLEKTALKPGR